MCPRVSFTIVLTVINKVNDFKVPRDSQVKLKTRFLIDVVPGVAVVVSYAPFFLVFFLVLFSN